MTDELVLDLFSGVGGWPEGADGLGLRDVGVEIDAYACATRRAAGHDTIRADVTRLPVHHLAGTGIVGVTGSPPCTLFAASGKGTGRAVVGLLADGIRCTLRGGSDCRDDVRRAVTPTAVAVHRRRYPQHDDPDVSADVASACLVLEPARVLAALIRGTTLRWAALEQVPAALPLWQAYAETLREMGWSAWAGVLRAADYGVPQLRRRAVLIASRDREVGQPEPTHAVPVTAAQALGWASTEREFWTLKSRRDSVNWVTSDGPRRNRIAAETAVTVTGEAHRWRWTAPDGREERLTVEQAGRLQTFRPDFPWQGPRTRQFLQCGNAMPPLLARRVLEEATGLRARVPELLAA